MVAKIRGSKFRCEDKNIDTIAVTSPAKQKEGGAAILKIAPKNRKKETAGSLTASPFAKKILRVWARA